MHALFPSTFSAVVASFPAAMAATAATSLLGSALLLPPAGTSTRRSSCSGRAPGAKMWIANANLPSWAVSGVPRTTGTVSPRAAVSSAESSVRIGAMDAASLPVKELMEALDAAGRRGAEVSERTIGRTGFRIRSREISNSPTFPLKTPFKADWF